MTKKVKVGIIGPGNIGQDLMIKISRSPLLELACVVGVVESPACSAPPIWAWMHRQRGGLPGAATARGYRSCLTPPAPRGMENAKRLNPPASLRWT